MWTTCIPHANHDNQFQPPTTGQVHPHLHKNIIAKGILTASLRQKLSESFDINFYWMRDQIIQGPFNLLWIFRILNMADYFKKHHPPWNHKKIQ